MSGVLRFVPWVFAIAGSGMLVGGGVSAYQQRKLVRDGHVVLGSVAQNVLIPAHYYKNSKGSRVFAPDAYAPQIQFVADDGRPHAVVLRRTSHTPEYVVGERIELIYPHRHPNDARLNQFGAIWEDTITVTSLGFFFVVMGVALAVLLARHTRRAKRPQPA